MGLAPNLSETHALHPAILDHVYRTMRRHGEGDTMAGFLIAVALTVLASILFDD
jgi:hypothetical protein